MKTLSIFMRHSRPRVWPKASPRINSSGNPEITRREIPAFAGMTAALMLLSACGSVLPEGEDAPRQFLLSIPRATAPVTAKPLPVSLQVIQPQAAPGLDSERIALRNSNHEMDYFAGARWSGSVPLIVQSQLVEAFENAHTMKSVASDLVQFNPDLQLAVEIRDFQAEYGKGAAPTVHLRLVARVIRGIKQEIIFTDSYEESEPATANRLQEVVAAYNIAFERISAHMVRDITKALGSKAAAKPLGKGK